MPFSALPSSTSALTSTASFTSQWALPDLNRERQMPDESQISVGAAGPRLRAQDVIECQIERMSETNQANA